MQQIGLLLLDPDADKLVLSQSASWVRREYRLEWEVRGFCQGCQPLPHYHIEVD